MFRYVCDLLLTVNPSRFEPGSMPTAMDCVLLPEGSTFNLTHQIPRFQNGVAFPDFTHRAARLGVVGISGFWAWSMTGTSILLFGQVYELKLAAISGNFKPYIHRFATGR